MILPENEFSHLKGVNKQPYLDIGTYASHLTNRCLFSCFSLLFLFYYIFYIHPIGHFQVAFCLCQNESKYETIHMTSTYRFIFHANQTQVSHEESLWNKRTTKHSSMSCLTGAFDFVLSPFLILLSLFCWFRISNKTVQYDVYQLWRWRKWVWITCNWNYWLEINPVWNHTFTAPFLAINYPTNWKARTRGLHRQHGSSQSTQLPLDQSVDVWPPLWDHGQLRLAFRNILDNPTLTRLVRLTLEVHDAEWTESSVALVSCGD